MHRKGSSPRARTLLLASLLLGVCAAHVKALTALGGWQQGFSTFYGGAPDGDSPYSPSFGTLDGSCGYGEMDSDSWPYFACVGISESNSLFSLPGKGCGVCVEVQCIENGPLGQTTGSCQSDPGQRSAVALVTDTCPQCESDHLDLQAIIWSKIANPSPSGGRINVQYRQVECAPPSDLVVNVDDNDGGNGWIRLQITKAGGQAAISIVELAGAGGQNFQQMNNVWGASWEMPVSPQPPLSVRVTDSAGNKVTARNVIQSGQTGQLPTSVQFKISDPSDVQPSGSTLGSPTSIQSASGTSTHSPGGSSSQVQAFDGPAPPTTSDSG